jgi:hypothetical protein
MAFIGGSLGLEGREYRDNYMPTEKLEIKGA